jgi:hypothetical protein
MNLAVRTGVGPVSSAVSCSRSSTASRFPRHPPAEPHIPGASALALRAPSDAPESEPHETSQSRRAEQQSRRVAARRRHLMSDFDRHSQGFAGHRHIPAKVKESASVPVRQGLLFLLCPSTPLRAAPSRRCSFKPPDCVSQLMFRFSDSMKRMIRVKGDSYLHENLRRAASKEKKNTVVLTTNVSSRRFQSILPRSAQRTGC